jgi:hypothetical protein
MRTDEDERSEFKHEDLYVDRRDPHFGTLDLIFKEPEPPWPTLTTGLQLSLLVCVA